MGNSKSESNISKSDSDSISNSAKNDQFETMDCQQENENTIINRVRIVKKSITLTNQHVFSIHLTKLEIPKQNVFNIKNEFNHYCNHWAIILELSNDSYVNIQFGRNGFSLKEFNNTNVEGESLLNSIIETWGEEGHPFSFCYLGIAHYEYDRLKNFLREKK